MTFHPNHTTPKHPTILLHRATKSHPPPRPHARAPRTHKPASTYPKTAGTSALPGAFRQSRIRSIGDVEHAHQDDAGVLHPAVRVRGDAYREGVAGFGVREDGVAGATARREGAR